MGIDKMSYEYISVAPEGSVSNSIELFNALKAQLPLELISISEERMLLRWADSAARTDWPEDIELRFSLNAVLIYFHVATAEQRRIFLSALEDLIYKRIGVVVKFEEQ